ncbi:unnamed protein product [Prorocentrum cordatum]|uniref:Armadillo repeat-containing protein 8 n=1 Tax=Prorocentrum cordatum TaxID=2364126 RepID=A0ABN9UWA3_9DINO|nr:unnamed protein product [Polarella glacialis]
MVLGFTGIPGAATLQAACRCSPFLEPFLRTEAAALTPGADWTAPSSLSWLAVLRRGAALAESWGDAQKTRVKLRSAKTEGETFETLELVAVEVGPPVFLCVAALVAAMRRHSSAHDIQGLCVSHLANLASPFPEAGRIAHVVGGTPMLLALLMQEDASVTVHQNCTTVLSAAMHRNSALVRAVRASGFIPRLVALSKRADGARKSAFLDAIIRIADDQDCLGDLRRAGAIGVVVPKLHARGGLEPILVLSGMVGEDAQCCAEFRTAGGLSRLPGILRSQDVDVRESGSQLLVQVLNKDRESCSAFSALAGALATLADRLHCEASTHVQGCAADALSCIRRGLDRRGPAGAGRPRQPRAPARRPSQGPEDRGALAVQLPAHRCWGGAGRAPATAARLRGGSAQEGALPPLRGLLGILRTKAEMTLGGPVIELCGTEDVSQVVAAAVAALEFAKTASATRATTSASKHHVLRRPACAARA